MHFLKHTHQIVAFFYQMEICFLKSERNSLQKGARPCSAKSQLTCTSEASR